MKWIMTLLLSMQLSAQAQTQGSMDLNGFLSKVRDRHEGLKALDYSKQASDDKRESGDLELQPVLTAKAASVNDKKQPNFLGVTETKTNQYSLGLNKKFSTGTLFGISYEKTDIENPGASGLFATFGKYSQGSVGVSLSQSLWKDAFGNGIRTRQKRDEYVAKAEKSGYSMQERQLLIEAEALYWDNIYLKEELTQREESLKRAQKIEGWVRRRVYNGIGDKADSLNAQALVAQRQLQLLSTKDDLTANQRKIRDFMELKETDPLPEFQGRIDLERNIRDRFRGAKKVVRLDALTAQLEAKTKSLVSEEVENANSADLNLSYSYKSNQYRAEETIPATSPAADCDGQMSCPTTTVALTWTYMFDTDVKNSAKSSARKEAMAADLRSQRKRIESDQAWQELLRRNDELTRRIEAARSIEKLQAERARAEQDKLSKGRSITQNVIQSEQDAAEADLTLIKLMAEQRKLESQVQMFVTAEEI
jgi:outer membrane protein TolC